LQQSQKLWLVMIDSHLPKVIRMERFEIVHKSIPEIQSNNCNFCEQLEKITDEGMEEYGNKDR